VDPGTKLSNGNFNILYEFFYVIIVLNRLGMVASQRFAHEAPHGAVRRYDELRGVSDRVQQHAAEIILPSGETPFAGSIISDYLHDEDEVTINLMNDLRVDACGSPTLTKWSSTAFMTSNSEASFATGKKDQVVLDLTDTFKVLPWDEKKAKIDFMRIVLCSQMLDQQKISHSLNTWWAHVATYMPKLPAEEAAIVKELCKTHYGVLFELFQNYAPDGRMNLKGFQVSDEIHN